MWLYKPQPTTPVAVEELHSRFVSLKNQLAARRPNDPPHSEARKAAVLATKEFERKIFQMYLVWSDRRTLATLRHDWEVLRERHFFIVEEVGMSTRELDEAQSVRDPAEDHDIFEGIRQAEVILRRIEKLHREVERLPEKERYNYYMDTAGPYFHSIQPWMRNPRLQLPDGALKQARSGWMILDGTRSIVFGVLTIPWVREFLLRTPRAVAGERRQLRELRIKLGEYFDDGSGSI